MSALPPSIAGDETLAASHSRDDHAGSPRGGNPAAAPGLIEQMGFLAGTRLATPLGYVAVERLTAGDFLLTADGRHARLRWIGMQWVEARAAHAPVVFQTGVMDNMRPLCLGQGHRLIVSGWRAEVLFDAASVQASAKGFVNGADVRIEEGETVTYCHLLFDRHEVVLAENVPCETLLPGPPGLARLDPVTRGNLLAACPGIASKIGGPDDGPALPLLNTAEAGQFCAV
ncbi:MAG: Hint domain-containing protein [Roseicyclus sp.]